MSLSVLGLFLLGPVPSNQLFIAIGVSRVPLIPPLEPTGGAADGTSVVKSLGVTTRLDLTDNKLVVTGDSISMLSEAILTGRPVGLGKAADEIVVGRGHGITPAGDCPDLLDGRGHPRVAGFGHHEPSAEDAWARILRTFERTLRE